MTRAELDRIAFYARGKAAALAALGLGVGGDDLLQEAMQRTVRGRRPWRKRVSLARHLIGVIASIVTVQAFWKHAIPKDSTITGPRVNLTFRRILGPSPT